MARIQRKFPRALAMRAESQTAFLDLDADLDDHHRDQWTALLNHALETRWDIPEAMDVFDVALEKGFVCA